MQQRNIHWEAAGSDSLFAKCQIAYDQAMEEMESGDEKTNKPTIELRLTWTTSNRLSPVVILELGDVRGVAFAPEGVADALVMRVGRGRGDEVEGAAHRVLVEDFMRDLRRRRGAHCDAAVIGVE
ncbi:hypothetical protein C8R44DRAFT_738867 [Mycena epipterygia]|nr:hypothetical protein C8R44DRAFT_738867 [Mycena epipterygia]